MMEILKSCLDKDGCLGVVRSADGDIKEFHRRGVIDLFELVTSSPEFLKGAIMADKVIGKGAALLLVKVGVSEVYARLISTPALSVLRNADVKVTFDMEVPNISNRTGDGICPVEKLTSCTDSPEKAYMLIKAFISEMKKNR
ncbi:MAG: DUF1893 domain-containing protein [Prevotellaceae bacterium]|nr:DUF1893 domain-containing protein [Prevotellaceae bacterium]